MSRDPILLALSGNYRFYDWDWWGRTLLRAYDFTLGPATHVLVKYILRIGVVFYGGNFAVRRDALDRIGGFDTRSSFTARTPTSAGASPRSGRVELRYDCFLYTSARRYNAMGKGAVFRLYVRNFVSEFFTTAQRIRSTSTCALDFALRNALARPQDCIPVVTLVPALVLASEPLRQATDPRTRYRRGGDVKLDTHVHTHHSGHTSIYPLSLIMSESYNTPEGVYALAKARGMDLVTITDHDRDQRRARRLPIAPTSSSAARSPASFPTTA